MMYAIKAPSGLLLQDTAATSRTKAWDALYDRHLCNVRDYWMYVWGLHRQKARREGYRCVPVVVKEATVLK